MNLPETIRVLALGDLVGRPGRRILRERLKALRAERALDFVIVNVENATNGAGTRPKEADEILAAGVDCMTNGDHIVDHPEINDYLEREPRLLRPLNYPLPGRGAHVYEPRPGLKIGVLSVCGHVFMKAPQNTQPAFVALEPNLLRLRAATPILFVDVHAEATSEKVAMGWHLDGRVSGVFGTHTHVQTSDAQVLPRGTGYITDLGMTGPHLGVIGRDKDMVLKRFMTGEQRFLKVAKEWVRMNGAIFTVETATGRCRDVELFSEQLNAGPDPEDP
ncbi:MAG: 2',3'-cyclic-nucleotide 2'-phosphodiesterase [Planctomycetes bacterium]|nr:2',3'-cyclic-nucleotide 2'-phosphodiesterase [Planctomycetota bacterium]GIK53004.1 MAG: metallophosphoesterase [Planctomycetota bacterium]